MTNGPSVPLTVIALTLNEEHHLPGFLDNVLGWASEVIIVDSLSSDKTLDIAYERGVQVIQRPFNNFGEQWNWALEHLPVRTPWTMKLDPDERVSEELKRQIADIVKDPNSATGYSFPRRLWFMRRPLHMKADVLRLWRTGSCKFSKVLVNEHPLINGSTGRLSGLLEHRDSPSLHQWVEKQNRYTTMEAVARARGHALAAQPKLLGNPLQRRMFFKQAFFHVPFRFKLYWLYLVFVKRACRDGRTGFAWAHLRTEVLRLRELKYSEIVSSGVEPKLPPPPHRSFDERFLATEYAKLVPEAAGMVTSAAPPPET